MTDFPFGIESQNECNDFLRELSKVLQYPVGQRVINRIISRCGIFLVDDNFQNQKQAFMAGQRNIGLQILNAVCDIDGGMTYTKMLQDYWKTGRHKEE